MATDIKKVLYELLTVDEKARVCKDIPEEAFRHQPRNFLTHVVSLAGTKLGDGLADPKLVLAWLLGALGAPAATIGLLVPLRESLALLPQLLIAPRIRAVARRKWVWVFGSAVQGLAVLAMGAVALTLDGAAAGCSIVGLLVIFALARSCCSVSYKVVLGKTVDKGQRGTATGTAGSIAASLVLLFGALLSFGILPLTTAAIAIVLLIAGAIWIAAGTLFSTLKEEAGASDVGQGLAAVLSQFSYLRDDPDLRRFLLTRGLLIATALAPPFMLALAGEGGERQIDALGPFVIASALAGMTGSYVWGRLADRSSRQVLMLAALIGALATGGVAIAAWLGLVTSSWSLIMPAALFVLMLAHQGVRLGRSTHLVDMANEDSRAAYTALSNTIIGVVLLAGGVFGLVAEVIGYAGVLGLFALMCLAAMAAAASLSEVQEG
ncbi:MAG: MFS transporter [Alphaproteobacteria bacterium]|nr:MFS transporter [Alphaproteobacteria bacterium]